MRKHIDTFRKFTLNENTDITKKSLEYSVNTGHNTKIDTWTGIRKSGDFFAYGKDTVNVKLENNTVGSKVWMRGYAKGFWVSITTIDDSALYADWYEALDEDTLQKVLHYFNTTVLNGLKNNEGVLEDLETIIGRKADGVDFS